MSDNFVHLHTHSQYSLLQGAIQMEDLVDEVAKLGQSAVALTDTNNLFGAIDFYLKAKEKGIKAIIGADVWYLEGGYPGAQQAAAQAAAAGPASQNFRPKFHPLVLLAKDLTGYRNLCKLITEAYKNSPPPAKGQPVIPKFLIDRGGLDKFGEGLIVLSGGLRSELAYRLLMGEDEEATATLQWFKKRFGEDYYLELQDNGLPEQDTVNEKLFALGEKHGIAVVGTTDVHYRSPDDAEAHEILQCIENGRNLDLDRPKSLVPAEYWLKPGKLMAERLARFPGAVENTAKIAAKCDVVFKFKDEQGRPIYHLPDFRPEGVEKSEAFDTVAYFREQAAKGLALRFDSPQFKKLRAEPDWAERKKEYEQRLEDELVMIARTGFAGYFLIVSDFIKWAKANDIPVGPGRGSGAGSLVAYSLFITDIDPIKFKLLFERFINPERISMPDFDVDFCQDRRGEVIEYVERKYGKENVCQIITFGKLQTRAAIKDVGRVLGLSFAETDIINKLVPETLGITIDEAIAQEPRLRELMEQDPKVNTVVGYARKLEGLYRNAGIHAAGVIITEEPVVNYCALYMSKDGDVVTQFDKDAAEKIGLVKYDFLGLKTLTVIDNAVKLVKSREDFRLEDMNYEDPKVFALISSGDTDGIFQVESSGMKDLCARLQPSTLDDLTALGALYRPGPLGSGMVDVFVDRKHGREKIEYLTPELGNILAETYGVIVYQEQVMQIARELAGYSLGQADLLRRAMGKKKPEEMAKHKLIFAEGAAKKGLKPEIADAIFDLMAKFAEYGFNKSHSAAYGVLTYQTAYLKTHYPAEFMAALMTTEVNDTDKITKYIANAKLNRIPVLPPDVNLSQKTFSVEEIEQPGVGPNGGVGTVRAIRFGLEAIKGVGGIAVDTILDARRGKPATDTEAEVVGGPFTSVLDFVRRVSTRKVNKKVLESLTTAGAFDPISEVNRPSLLASLEKLLEFASDEQEEKALGQTSLFDSFSAEDVKLITPTDAIFQKLEDWPQAKRLIMEKQVVGFYVSGHPMDAWQTICAEWLGWSIEKLKEWGIQKAAEMAAKPAAQEGSFEGGRFQRPKRPEVRVAGLIGETKEIMTKKGSRMAFSRLEDLASSMEIVFFPESFAQNGEMLKRAQAEAAPLLITGEVEAVSDGAKIFVKTLEWVEEAHKNRVQQVILRIPLERVSSDQLRELKKNIIAFRGKCPVRIEFSATEGTKFKTRLELPKNVGLQTSPQMVESVNRIFGFNVVHLV
ncbi:MAG: DNA polymerase III subunit alpha [Bdellovibrionales bacterium]|nr:DNA polymerase III subunit alpha [Bdellovibrionales bacterium]